jgi:hypothetical protein
MTNLNNRKLGSVASLLAASLYLENPDRNKKLKTTYIYSICVFQLYRVGFIGEETEVPAENH